jgi:hypothetical protein
MRQFFLRCYSWVIVGSYPSYLSFGENGLRSIIPKHIGGIVGWSSKFKMVWAHALSIGYIAALTAFLADMQYSQSFRDKAEVQYPTSDVRKHVYSVRTFAENSIPIVVYTCYPDPTGLFRRIWDENFIPETRFGCLSKTVGGESGIWMQTHLLASLRVAIFFLLSIHWMLCHALGRLLAVARAFVFCNAFTRSQAC